MVEIINEQLMDEIKANAVIFYIGGVNKDSTLATCKHIIKDHFYDRIYGVKCKIKGIEYTEYASTPQMACEYIYKFIVKKYC